MDSTLDILDAHVMWIIISCKIFVTHHLISSDEKLIPEKNKLFSYRDQKLIIIAEVIFIY